jgi:hypothetical protein
MRHKSLGHSLIRRWWGAIRQRSWDLCSQGRRVVQQGHSGLSLKLTVRSNFEGFQQLW